MFLRPCQLQGAKVPSVLLLVVTLGVFPWEESEEGVQ